MSSATTKSQRQPGVEVVCDILEWSCTTSDVWIALESSGYAGQVRGGKSGQTQREVVSGLQHFDFLKLEYR